MIPAQQPRSFRKDQSGAVAVTYALALTALIATAGVGFDYARLMALDSEMQSAADEAALAAATQLDGRANAIARAKSAVNDYFAKSGSNVVNRTLMANDKAGSELTGVTFTFYTSFDSATDTFGSVTTTDSTAKVVKVTINSRKAFYAFTAIVGAFNSGNVTADAVASLQAGTCKLPPLLICGPNGNADFPTAADVGKGLLLKVDPGSQWAPGNFGYVDFGAGSTMVKDLLGNNSAADSCVPGSSLTTQPGNIASATDYLNTRFDIYTLPLRSTDCASNGDKCPAQSTRKDLVIKEVFTYAKVDGPPLGSPQTYPAAPTRPPCGATAPTGGSRTVDTDWSVMPNASIPPGTQVGFPRDSGYSTAIGTIGNGVWDVSGYYAAHPYLPAGMTHRWDIYKWERDNPGSGLQASVANTADSVQWTITKSGPGAGNAPCKAGDAACGYTATWTNYCSYPAPKFGTYHATAKDRRVMTVAVADCSSAGGGAQTLPVNKWMDVFLTEPSWNRTSPATSTNEIYAEIIGPATRPDGGNAFQYYARNKAVLLQ